jgi:2Fe-2S ferredoxin
MPSITFVLPDATERTVQARSGSNVMRIALDHDMPGIIGECGGSATCSTCHVWVDAAWIDRLPIPLEDELDSLQFVAGDLRPGSRLGCQIGLHDGLDGLRIELP